MDEQTPNLKPHVLAESPQRPKGPLALLGLWGLMIWLSIILGLVFFVVGILSHFIDGWPLQMMLCGLLVQTPVQKTLFAAAGAALAIIGVSFWWMRQHRYIVVAGLVYLAVVLVVVVLQWATGSNDFISISWDRN